MKHIEPGNVLTMLLIKKSKTYFRLGWILAFNLLLASAQEMSFAAGVREQDSVLTPTPVGKGVVSCTYNFSDTYYGTSPGTSPPTVPFVTWPNNGYPGWFGPIMQLKFNNFGSTPSPTTSTPAVPCTGKYEVAFSVELRNNSGPGCNNGENSVSIWVTGLDPTASGVPAGNPPQGNPPGNVNVYGCPIAYVDTLNRPQTSGNPNYTMRVNVCNTFSQWVQCAWTNNVDWGKQGGNFLYYGVVAFPIYMYTPSWTYNYYGNQNRLYKDMCGSNNYSPCWLPYGVRGSYQTAFCSLKPFYFKTIVTLKKGTIIYAPALATQIVLTPYQFSTGGYAACSTSVTGGKFSVTYIGN
jgi:hypothetical protein